MKFLRSLEKIKQLNSNTKIVLGGDAIHYYDSPEVDYLIQGQGEVAVIMLTNGLQSGNPPKQRIISNDDYPYLSFNTSTIQWHHNDIIFPNEHLPIEISRGCRFRCSFCAYKLNGKIIEDFSVRLWLEC